MMFSRVAFPVYIILLCLLTFYLSRFPGHNGDMPYYIACAIEKDQGSMDGVVKQTMEVLQKELSVREYNVHAQRFSETDPEILERYRIKPFYILVVLALHKLGFSYIVATVLPSVICYFLIGLSIWQILVSHMDPVKAFLVGMVSMIIYPTLLLARLSSPDSISCFVLLNAFNLIYTGRRLSVWYILFLFALIVRPDNLVSEIIFLAALWKWPAGNFKNKLDFKSFAFLSISLVLMACLVNGLSAHHFFWFLDSRFSLPAGQYIKDIALYFLVIPGSFFMYLLLLFIISGLINGFSWKQEANYIFYAVCVVVIIRFLLYPYYEERYFTPCFLFSMLVISIRAVDFSKRVNSAEGGTIH